MQEECFWETILLWRRFAFLNIYFWDILHWRNISKVMVAIITNADWRINRMETRRIAEKFLKSHRGHPRNSFFRSVVVLLFLLFFQSRDMGYSIIKKLHPADICPKYKVQTCRKCPEKKAQLTFLGHLKPQKELPRRVLILSPSWLRGRTQRMGKETGHSGFFFYRRKKTNVLCAPLSERGWFGTRK